MDSNVNSKEKVIIEYVSSLTQNGLKTSACNVREWVHIVSMLAPIFYSHCLCKEQLLLDSACLLILFQIGTALLLSGLPLYITLSCS